MIEITLKFDTIEEASEAIQKLQGAYDVATPAEPKPKRTRKKKAAPPVEEAVPEPTEPEPAAEPEAAAPADTAPAPTVLTIEQVRARVGQLAQAMPDQGASLGQLLANHYNVAQLPALPAEHYGSFIALCEDHARSMGVSV